MPVYCNVSTPSSRYVFIQQPANGPGSLSICELEVYGKNNADRLHCSLSIFHVVFCLSIP